MKFDKELYKNFSKLYGVVYQDNQKFLNRVNNLDFNIDLSMDDIAKIYSEKEPEKSNNNILENENVMDVNTQIITTLASLNPKELEILRFVNK